MYREGAWGSGGGGPELNSHPLFCLWFGSIHGWVQAARIRQLWSLLECWVDVLGWEELRFRSRSATSVGSMKRSAGSEPMSQRLCFLKPLFCDEDEPILHMLQMDEDQTASCFMSLSFLKTWRWVGGGQRLSTPPLLIVKVELETQHCWRNTQEKSVRVTAAGPESADLPELYQEHRKSESLNNLPAFWHQRRRLCGAPNSDG